MRAAFRRGFGNIKSVGVYDPIGSAALGGIG